MFSSPSSFHYFLSLLSFTLIIYNHVLTQGSLLWDKGVQFQEKAAQHFLIAAKLDPLNGLAFKFLGHFYSVVNLDVQRAIKCFQRALQLNPDDSDSGVIP